MKEIVHSTTPQSGDNEYLQKRVTDLEFEIANLLETQTILIENEKNLSTFFNTIDHLLFVLDGAGNILSTNATVNRKLGYTNEELIGQSVLTVHPPKRREEAGQIVREMLAGTADYCPVPLITKDGRLIPVETRVIAGKWSGKDVIFGVTKDLSDIKASEEKFSKAFHASPSLMAISEVESGKYLDVNETFLQTLGYTRGEIIGKTSIELGLFGNAEERHKLLERMRLQGSLKNEEIMVYTKSKAIRHGLFSAEFIQLQDRILLLTGMNDITERIHAEEALKKANEQLRSHVKEIEKLQDELHEQAVHDPLTKLHNRRHLDEMLIREMSRAKREKHPLSAIISDIDHFKKINDTHGHLIGDKFLVEIAGILRKHARRSDIVCRYGGEEFLLILAGASAKSALQRAEEIRQKCAELCIPHKGRNLRVTISMGVATYPTQCKNTEELLVLADRALYQSKKGGRNMVTLWEE